MRQRITFIQDLENSIDPKLLKIDSTSIKAKGLKAAREDRITFSLSELPQEHYRALNACYELHIRWISPRSYETTSPLLSRLSPGLHVFYTPRRDSNTTVLVCPTLKKLFGEIDCRSSNESFTNLPSERFSLSAASQYYQPLSSLADLVEYLKHKVCKNSQTDCLARVSSLLQASSIDIDFDTISHALTLTAFWEFQTWDLDLTNTTPNERLEVGILAPENAIETEELALGGFLTIVGDDTKPSPTLFSFPSRHHPLSSTFKSTLLLPTGLHPTLQLEITSNTPPMDDRSCSMHAHLTLPRSIFADKYQFRDSLFLASKNLSALHYITSPVDLEAPEYAISQWGSSVLLELAPPSPPTNSKFTTEIPLHLRYLAPRNGTSGLTNLELPYPVVFWACTAVEGSKFPMNPFDRINLGYEGLFGPRTMFYHVSPDAGRKRLVNEIAMPVADLDKSQYVEIGTAAVVAVGFLWVLWCLVGVFRRSGYGRVKNVGEKKWQ
ncbi:hypothetical protein B7494_g5797 [Chlorociboria aeruginascens]|nr:hypothetical protein B7494_g5797 [Chlorociboria aeruginascens]